MQNDTPPDDGNALLLASPDNNGEDDGQEGKRNGSVDSHYFANKSNMSKTSNKHLKRYDTRKRAEKLTKHRCDEGGGNGDGDGGAPDLADSRY